MLRGASPERLARRIVEESRALGFHRVGIAPVEPAARHHVYRAWVERGLGGEMGYLVEPEGVEARRDPRVLLEGARTVVVVAWSYGGPDAPPRPAPPGCGGVQAGPRGVVARYARGDDYHLVLKTKLRDLAERVAQEAGRPVAARPCVDTAPLLERDFAERAGIGFVAKNTMLIAPGLGSYVLLGELLLDVDVTPTAEEPPRKRCGDCRACLDACPTGAFVDAFVLDARRCISYLTIELRGAIPRELRPLVGTRIFGCDVCQEVCPFNAAAMAGHAEPPAPELAPRDEEHATPALVPLLSLGAARFRRYVERSAMRRVRREQLLRNVCVALGNAGDPSAIPALRGALADRHPLVRAHAAWALGRLGDRGGLEARHAVEDDAQVLEEIEHALVALADSAASGPPAGPAAPPAPGSPPASGPPAGPAARGHSPLPCGPSVAGSGGIMSS